MEKNENSDNTNTGFKLEHKLLIFFGGLFIVAFAGFKYFENIPGGTKKDRNLAIVLYYLGVLFWAACFVGVVFLT